MSKVYYYLLLTFLLISCFSNRSKEQIISEDTKIAKKYFSEMDIYNDILNNLIEHHFYYRYLDSEQRKKLLVKYFRNEIDSITFTIALNEIKEQLKNHPEKRKYIFLKMNLDSTFFSKDNLRLVIKSDSINIFLNNNNRVMVIDSLGSFNNRLRPSDFNLELARIRKLEEQKHVDFSKLSFKELTNLYKNDPLRNEIGYFAFSKVYLNKTRDKGLVYYIFNCGPKCGRGELLYITKVNNKWIIKEKELFIIS